MKNSTRAALLLAGALVLAGCSEGRTDWSAPEAVEGSPIPAQQADMESGAIKAEADPGQAWANEKMDQWLASEGANSVRGFYPPYNLIRSWDSTRPGEVTLTVGSDISAGDDVYHDSLGPANDLWLIAAVMLDSIGTDAPDIKKVTAVTDDGKRTETYTREDQAHSRAVRSGEFVYP